MSHQPTQSLEPAGNPQPAAAHPRTAVRWIMVLVVGVGFAAFVAARDGRNRSLLEQAVERTAVGDRLFYPLEGGPALRFEAASLVRAEAPEPKLEVSMIAAGTLDGSPHRLYVPGERVDDTGGAVNSNWWLKTGPGFFLKVSRE